LFTGPLTARMAGVALVAAVSERNAGHAQV
jgi:hypothetical protein